MNYSVLSRKLVGSGISCCSSSTERCRYKQNWIVLTAYCALVGFCYSSALPSLHQFVTSSSHQDDPTVQPGLGLSETWYSWIVSIISIGELIGAIATSFLLRHIFTKIYLLINLAIVSLGGLLYGVGQFGWMLLIGRLLIGFSMGAVTVVLRTYIGETASTVIASMPKEKRAKSTLKYTAFFFAFTTCAFSLLFGPAFAAMVSQIPSIDQFRWLGYFTIILAILLCIATLVWFREHPGDVRKRGEGGKINVRNLPIPIYTLICLVAAFFVINWYFAVFETLLNPVLADNFGFDVEYDSYAFVGTLPFFTCGMLILYTLQRLHIDNRVSSVLAVSLALCGSIIATDWQAIQGDPCNQFSRITGGVNYSYETIGNDNGSGRVVELWCEHEPQNFLCVAEKHRVDLDSCGPVDELTVLNSSCVCEAFSAVPEYNCFWNPHSRVTGRDCQRCAKICRSHQRSLNLVQFLVGMSMVSLIIAMGRISITLITSDALAGQSQAVFMGTLVAMGATARFTGPLWGNAAYLGADHHVYIVMNILSASALLVLVPFLLLYRTMKPSNNQSSSSSSSSVDSCSVTTENIDLQSLLNDGDTVELIENGGVGEEKNEVTVSIDSGGHHMKGEVEKEEEEEEGEMYMEEDEVKLLVSSTQKHTH